jgi:cysteine synthase A
MVCAQKSYPLVVTMAENFSVERRKLMRFLGAKVILTPASEKGSGMLAKALELAQAHGWFLCGQFENEANPDFHSKTTAVEILEAFAGDRLDYWVTGMGTGGTLKGVARVLRKERPETKIVVCEPDNSPLLGSGIAQARGSDSAPLESHPFFRPHLMQGWTPDFIPKLAEDAVKAGLIDEVVPIKGGDALRCACELAQKEGILTGITGGATFAGALQSARGPKRARKSCACCRTPASAI